MISALDSSLLVDAMDNLPVARRTVVQALEDGGAVVCGAVFAELLSDGRTPDALEAFLRELGIELDATMDVALWRLAGERHATYVARRRAAGVSADRRLLLLDFIIGAHGLLRADRLVTRDKGIYRTYFADLPLLDY